MPFDHKILCFFTRKTQILPRGGGGFDCKTPAPSDRGGVGHPFDHCITTLTNPQLPPASPRLSTSPPLPRLLHEAGPRTPRSTCHTNHQSHTSHNTKQHLTSPHTHLTTHIYHPAPLHLIHPSSSATKHPP